MKLVKATQSFSRHNREVQEGDTLLLRDAEADALIEAGKATEQEQEAPAPPPGA